jgi:hypothetical protein
MVFWLKKKLLPGTGRLCYLPTIRDVLVGWNTYRLQWQLQWSDMIIFKDDIKGCFNQLRWSTPSTKLLGSMVDDDVVYLSWLTEVLVIHRPPCNGMCLDKQSDAE